LQEGMVGTSRDLGARPNKGDEVLGASLR